MVDHALLQEPGIDFLYALAGDELPLFVPADVTSAPALLTLHDLPHYQAGFFRLQGRPELLVLYHQ